MTIDTLFERAEFVAAYKPTMTTSGKRRKRPTTGLKRHFNTPTGKKILSEDHKRKISEGLKRYNKLHKTQTDE